MMEMPIRWSTPKTTNPSSRRSIVDRVITIPQEKIPTPRQRYRKKRSSPLILALAELMLRETPTRRRNIEAVAFAKRGQIPEWTSTRSWLEKKSRS